MISSIISSIKLSLNPYEKVKFSLKRRLEAYNSQYGEISPIIEKKLENLISFLVNCIRLK
jgi:septation ring formation regulator EzrA